MLKIYYGDLESDNYIFNPDVFFNNSYEDEWITDSFSVEMNLGKTVHNGVDLVESVLDNHLI
ncbi:MAG: hypothetical protein IIZ20_03030 [Butyrivibrio sp.]|nr:hypothetical protein [Butyrivibrio sp.]